MRAFRKFIRSELMPEVKKRCQHNQRKQPSWVNRWLELFVVETITILEARACSAPISRLTPASGGTDKNFSTTFRKSFARSRNWRRPVSLASSDEKELIKSAQRLAATLGKDAPPGLRWPYEAMPGETHATIYHPAALKAFRSVLKPKMGEEPKK